MNPHQKPTQLGVSLLEVLIALVVIAVGVLGLAKMQALSIATAGVSGSRSLIALQASSLASIMHGNKLYWQSGAGSALCNTATACKFTGSKYTANPVFGTVPTSCYGTTAATTCTPAGIAAVDMSIWMNNMYTQVPSYNSIINCSSTPTNCTIEITWTEKAIGMNNTTASQAATANTTPTTQTYYLYVQP